MPMDDFYISSFWDLNTTRNYEMGPVPWNVIAEYGYHIGLFSDILDQFVAIIRAIDAKYLEWAAGEIDRQRNQNTPQPTKR